MKAIASGVAALVMILPVHSLMAEERIRNAPSPLIDETLVLGDVAVANDRYVGVLLPEEKAISVIDQQTWLRIDDPNGGGDGLLDVCVLETGSTRPTSMTAFGDDDGAFIVACEGGLLSYVEVDAQSDNTYSTMSITTVQIKVDDVAVDTPLLDVAISVEASTIYAVGDDYYLYALPLTTFADGTATRVLLGANLESPPSALALDRGPGSIPASTVAAVGYEDGTVSIYGIAEAKILAPFACFDDGSAVTDIVGFNNQFLVSYASDAMTQSLGAIAYGIDGASCFADNSAFEGILGPISSMSLSMGGADSGLLYLLGEDGSGAGDISTLALEWFSGITVSETQSVVGVDEAAGTVAATSTAQEFTYYAAESAFEVIGESPFLSADVEVEGVDEGAGDATPTGGTVTTEIDYYLVSVALDADEAGTIEIYLDGALVSDLSASELDESVYDESTGLYALDLTFEVDTLEEGSHSLEVQVTDSDGATGSVLRYFYLEEAPSTLSGFDAGFGDGVMILTWSEPSNDAITHYEFVMTVSDIGAAAPYQTGEDFMSSGGTSSFMAAGQSYPTDYTDADGVPGWPIRFVATDAESAGDDGLLDPKLTYTIAPLDNRTETTGTEYWAAVRAVEVSGTDVRYGPWTHFVSAVPELTGGSAAQSGEVGGFGCGGCGSDSSGGETTPAFILLGCLALGRRRLRRFKGTDIS